MKAVRSEAKARACNPKPKARLRAHAVYMYKLCREFAPVPCRPVNESRLFVLRRVGSEAARLAAFNRRGIITTWEIRAAVKQISHRRNARAPLPGA